MCSSCLLSTARPTSRRLVTPIERSLAVRWSWPSAPQPTSRLDPQIGGSDGVSGDDRWNGTLVTTTSGSNKSSRLKNNAVWLCRSVAPPMSRNQLRKDDRHDRVPSVPCSLRISSNNGSPCRGRAPPPAPAARPCPARTTRRSRTSASSGRSQEDPLDGDGAERLGIDDGPDRRVMDPGDGDQHDASLGFDRTLARGLPIAPPARAGYLSRPPPVRTAMRSSAGTPRGGRRTARRSAESSTSGIITVMKSPSGRRSDRADLAADRDQMSSPPSSRSRGPAGGALSQPAAISTNRSASPTYKARTRSGRTARGSATASNVAGPRPSTKKSERALRPASRRSRRCAASGRPSRSAGGPRGRRRR